MAESRRTTYNSIRPVIDVAFIAFGAFLFLKVINLPEMNFWYAWLIAIFGVMFASLPYPSTRRAGAAIALFGVYSILRIADVISLPLLQYGLASLFIFIGTVNLVRGAQGKGAQVTNTPKNSVQ